MTGSPLKAGWGAGAWAAGHCRSLGTASGALLLSPPSPWPCQHGAAVNVTANTMGHTQFLFNSSQDFERLYIFYTSTCQVTNIENIKYMHISKTTWALSYKTIQCTCKPEDHVKGFLHIKYLVPSKTGVALDISDVNSSSENF